MIDASKDCAHIVVCLTPGWLNTESLPPPQITLVDIQAKL